MANLKLKRITSSSKAKLIQTDNGGYVLGVDTSNKYKTYDAATGEYLGGVFKSEAFNINNANGNPTVYPGDYDVDVKTRGAKGNFTKLVQYDGVTVGLKAETLSGASVYSEYTSSYIDIPANVVIYATHDGTSATLNETYFNSLSSPRFLLSGIPHAYMIEVPMNEIYYDYDNAIIYGDGFAMKNAYNHEWDIDVDIANTYDIYLHDGRYYNNININNKTAWASYNVGLELSGNCATAVETPVPMLSTGYDTFILKNYEFVERIKGLNTFGSDELHKSNVFSIEIKNSKLNENVTDDTSRTKIQTYINNVIREVITKISPAHTQLWKIDWKGE